MWKSTSSVCVKPAIRSFNWEIFTPYIGKCECSFHIPSDNFIVLIISSFTHLFFILKIPDLYNLFSYVNHPTILNIPFPAFRHPPSPSWRYLFPSLVCVLLVRMLGSEKAEAGGIILINALFIQLFVFFNISVRVHFLRIRRRDGFLKTLSLFSNLILTAGHLQKLQIQYFKNYIRPLHNCQWRERCWVKKGRCTQGKFL